MKTHTLLLAAFLAVILVVPRTTARPQPGGASYVKAQKSSQSAQSTSAASASENEEYVADSASGSVSSKSSKSSSSAVSSSSQSNSESYEAYSASAVCDDTLEEKLCGETDIAYYKRIFAVDESCSCSKSEFYSKVFKQYNGESNADYIKRINFIFTNVYPSLDCRFNEEYVKFLEKYYLIGYAKNSGECDEDYFKRILTKSTESEEIYTKKVTILKKFVTNVEWSKVQIDAKSKTGYSLVSQSSTTSKSSESKSVKKCLTEEEIKKTYAKTEKEDITTYYKRIVTKSSTTVTSEEYVETISSIRKAYPDLNLWYDTQYIDYVKDYYNAIYTKKSSETEETYFKRIVTKESYETDECFAKRLEVLHQLNPTLALWSSEKYYESLTKSYYKTYYAKSTSEDETTYYSRITSKLDKESETDYINRISLIRRTYYTLPLWYSGDYLELTKGYYTAKYTKLSTEKEETYFKRIVTKESFETDEEWAKRLDVVRNVFPKLTLWSDEKYYDGYTKKYIETIYKRSQSEDETTYYSRIIKKYETESTTEYYNRISLIKRTFSTLPVWYSDSYKTFTKQYYTAKYTKLSSEEEEVYYKRIVTKEVGETDEECAKRVHIVHQIYPSLSLWYNSKYYESYTKQIYSTVYKKASSEDETTYYKRICTKLDQESDVTYAKRLTLIRKTFSSLDLWYSEKYFSTVKEYYGLTYAKQSGETDEAYITRLVKRECTDSSDEIYAQRLHLVHTLTASSSVWSNTAFYEKYLSSYYKTYYARAAKQSCVTWLKNVLTQLSGECEDAAVTRITQIKRAVANDCDCWNDAVLTEATQCGCFSSEYVAKIRSACFTQTTSIKSSSSSSSSSVSSASQQSEEVTMVSRG